MDVFKNWLRQKQPSLSESEIQALNAGGIWFEGQFFLKKPDWQSLFDLKLTELTQAENHFIHHECETLCSMINDWDIHQQQNLPEAAWHYIKENKFWGLIIPKQFGGLGFSALAHSTIVSKIASRSIAAAITIMVPNSLGPAEFLMHYGTKTQQEKYLPRLAIGSEVACFALTSPVAGSDATGIQDTGVVCQGEFNGEKTLGIKLNFDKHYITLAPVATLIGLAFKMQDPDHLLGDKEDIGITLALLPADLPGVEKGLRHNPMHLGFMNGPIRGRDVFIPLDYIIGGKEKRGQGWLMMMECLAIGRGISLPSLATAACKFSLFTTTAYAQVRKQFNRSIGDFEGIEMVIARMTAFTFMADAVRLLTVEAVEQNARPAVASAIAKYHLTELARVTVNHAMDVHGGRGIQMGPSNYLAILYNSLPVSVTVEGANILTRNLMIYGQGVMRCHPYLQRELKIIEKKGKSDEAEFDRLVKRHFIFIAGNVLTCVWYGISAGRFIKVPNKKIMKPYLKRLTRISNAFSVATDILLAVLGKKFKIKESLSARMGDVLSYLYIASAIIKHVDSRDSQLQDDLVMRWSLEYCLQHMTNALFHVYANFPNRMLGKCLQYMAFPWGRPYLGPKDKLGMALADQVQKDLRFRGSLTEHCYIKQSDNDPVGRMEKVLNALHESDELNEEIISARLAAVKVDEFTSL